MSENSYPNRGQESKPTEDKLPFQELTQTNTYARTSATEFPVIAESFEFATENMILRFENPRTKLPRLPENAPPFLFQPLPLELAIDLDELKARVAANETPNHLQLWWLSRKPVDPPLMDFREITVSGALELAVGREKEILTQDMTSEPTENLPERLLLWKVVVLPEAVELYYWQPRVDQEVRLKLLQPQEAIFQVRQAIDVKKLPFRKLDYSVMFSKTYGRVLRLLEWYQYRQPELIGMSLFLDGTDLVMDDWLAISDVLPRPRYRKRRGLL